MIDEVIDEIFPLDKKYPPDFSGGIFVLGISP